MGIFQEKDGFMGISYEKDMYMLQKMVLWVPYEKDGSMCISLEKNDSMDISQEKDESM